MIAIINYRFFLVIISILLETGKNGNTLSVTSSSDPDFDLEFDVTSVQEDEWLETTSVGGEAWNLSGRVRVIDITRVSYNWSLRFADSDRDPQRTFTVVLSAIYVPGIYNRGIAIQQLGAPVLLGIENYLLAHDNEMADYYFE